LRGGWGGGGRRKSWGRGCCSWPRGLRGSSRRWACGDALGCFVSRDRFGGACWI